MTPKYAFLRPLLPILLLTTLSGCLSTSGVPIPVAMLNTPALYVQSQLAWKNAALRENDLFRKHKLQILAGVSWEKRSDATTYKFTDLSLGTQTNPEDKYRLDLISPRFNQKMACGWYCEFLNQPITQTISGLYTMLDKIYESQNVDLHNFYQELEWLNQNLNSLDSEIQALMPEIFADLTNTQRTFDSLTQIVGFINDYFDELDLNSLRSKEYTQTIPVDHIKSDLPTTPTQQTILDPQAELIASFRPELSLAEMLNPKSEPIKIANRADSGAILVGNPTASRYALEKPTNSDTQTTVAQALAPEKIILNLQQFVCSYEGNYFGTVIAIKNETVTVNLNGQAMSIKDGLVVNAENGVLLSRGSEFSYLTLDGDKYFKDSQLKPCHLNGF
jgi:hypothetical protein